MVKNKPLTWWNPQLEIRKKQLNALRRRMQKSEGAEKEKYTSAYSKTRATYKKKFSTQNAKPGENSAQNQVLLLENLSRPQSILPFPHLKSLKP
ncbi:hypothetical protein CDAR_214001 [Caerostris darwini]|uniref:Uncharacterized protein n=1 Tax=Caerostris darwini TaxID=1538125 RepID=A0AAV4QEL3_9ARAC|nr:hypothetical protein CDAR_209971 [Caerostris darwini]GIY24489.1 hypothetical protein CDAR_170151 [Caerostris darwini]GIY33221.1 hypothetical protein CDAR_214001 [Caerostris darwini]